SASRATSGSTAPSGSTSAPTVRARWRSASSPSCSPSFPAAHRATSRRAARPSMSAEASATAARGGAVAGILLAAGTSSRMGENKLLLAIEGEPLLARSARHALGAGLEPLVVVVGHQEERARAALAELPCEIVTNLGYEEGIASSLWTGLRALPASAGATVVMLADMP